MTLCWKDDCSVGQCFPLVIGPSRDSTQLGGKGRCTSSTTSDGTVVVVVVVGSDVAATLVLHTCCALLPITKSHCGVDF